MKEEEEREDKGGRRRSSCGNDERRQSEKCTASPGPARFTCTAVLVGESDTPGDKLPPF